MMCTMSPTTFLAFLHIVAFPYAVYIGEEPEIIIIFQPKTQIINTYCLISCPVIRLFVVLPCLSAAN